MTKLTKKMVKEIIGCYLEGTTEKILSIDLYENDTQADVVVKSKNNCYRQLVISRYSIEDAKVIDHLVEIPIHYQLFGFEKFYSTNVYMTIDEFKSVVGA